MIIYLNQPDGSVEEAIRCDTCRRTVLRNAKGPIRRYCGKSCRQIAYYRRHRQVENPVTG